MDLIHAQRPGDLAVISHLRSSLLLAFLSSIALGAIAQETINNASLSGRVTDSSGAVIRDAAVTARQVATNRTRDTHTDSEGRFRFAYLQVGQYEVTVRQHGFSDADLPVTLTIGAAFDLPIKLAVGSQKPCWRTVT